MVNELVNEEPVILPSVLVKDTKDDGLLKLLVCTLLNGKELEE